MLKIKRVDAKSSEADGTRVLIERSWPKGVDEDRADVDWWAKELAPSSDLREWFGQDPGRFEEFGVRYRRELEGNESLPKLEGLMLSGALTLLYASDDDDHNHAVVLKELLEEI